MITVLLYLFFAAVIGLVVFALAVLVFGRGEQMAPLSPRTSPAELPDDGIIADDVRRIRFSMALRGYRMSDVDWTLERLAEELTVLRAEIAELRENQPGGDGWPSAADVPADGVGPGTTDGDAGDAVTGPITLTPPAATPLAEPAADHAEAADPADPAVTADPAGPAATAGTGMLRVGAPPPLRLSEPNDPAEPTPRSRDTGP